MNCLVIDDEPLAREGLATYIKDIDFLQLKGICESPIEAIPLMEKENIDLLFLDIQMPKINGLDFLKSLQKAPLVIITTAFPSFALEGFQLNVLDYLVKPITFQRFFKAANKAKNQFKLLHPDLATSSKDHFFIKCDHKFEKIKLDELLFIESMQNYITLHTQKGKFTTLLSLKSVLEELPPERFIQVHKSYIVAVDKIESLEGNQLAIGKHTIPVSRSSRDNVMSKVVTGRLWKK